MKEATLSSDEVRTHAARGALSVFTRHAVVRMIAFASTLVLARLLDPHTFGVFALAQFVLSLANAVAVGGVTAALTRRREAVSPLEYRTAHLLQLMIAAVIFAAVLALTPALAAAYDLTRTEAWAFPAMGAAVFLLASRSIPATVLQRTLRHDLIAVTEVAEYVTYVVASIALALAGFGLWALVCGTLLRYLVATALLYRAARGRPGVAFRRDVAARILREFLPQQTTILLNLSQRAINTTVVAAVLSPAAAGLVGMATTLLDSLVLQPLTLLANIQFRLLARVQDDRARFRGILGESYFLSSVVCLPILIGAIAIFPMLVEVILPPSWARTGYLVQVLSLASLAQLISSPTSQALKALGDIKSMNLCYLASALVQLGILVLAGKAWGLTGFAVANIVGCAMVGLYGLWRVRVLTGCLPPLGPLAGVWIAAGVAAGVGWIAIETLPASWQLAGAAAGALAYPPMLLVTSGRRVATYLRLAGDAIPARLTMPCRLFRSIAAIADRCGGKFSH